MFYCQNTVSESRATENNRTYLTNLCNTVNHSVLELWGSIMNETDEYILACQVPVGIQNISHTKYQFQ